MRARAVLATLLAFASAELSGLPLAAAEPLSAAALRGKQFYLNGQAPGGAEVVAQLEGGAEVPATTLSCQSCHGYDGRGRPEGSVAPPSVFWSALTRPYEVQAANGRTRPAYDESSLKRALMLGLDSAGNRLSPVMPRYRLPRDVAADLIAYLKRLDDERDPGVGEQELSFGTVLPPDAHAAEALRRLFDGLFKGINQGGGIYGRKLRLATLETRDGPATEERLRRFVADEQPFALLAPWAQGEEAALTALAAGERLPLLGLAAGEPVDAASAARYCFYLQPGEAGVLEGLAEWWRGHHRPGERLALLLPEEPLAQARARAVAERLEGEAPQVESYPAGRLEPSLLLARLGAEVSAVLFLGTPGDAEELLGAAASGKLWLMPGRSFAGLLSRPRPDFGGRLLAGFPDWPTDFDPQALETIRRLAGLGPGPDSSLPLLRQAYAATGLAVEALRRLGRDVRREGLVETLAQIYDFPTGVMRPLSFGRGRQSGTDGLYVVEFDPVSARPKAEPEWLGLTRF